LGCGQSLKTDFLNVCVYNSAEATSLNTTLPMLLPGVKLSTSLTDLRPMKQTWLQRFDGERWRLFGDVVDVTK
jgi:hypothetical protein